MGPSLLVAGQSLPTFGTRNVTTRLRLRDGESNLLAGLLREQGRQTLKGSPGLLRLLVIRHLFSSTDRSVQNTDLVMPLTPRIVRGHELTQQDVSPIHIDGRGTRRRPAAGGDAGAERRRAAAHRGVGGAGPGASRRAEGAVAPVRPAVLLAPLADGASCDSVPLVAPTRSSVRLVVADASLPNGASVTAAVTEAAGAPVHNGTVVTFTATLGTVHPAEAPTARGRASAPSRPAPSPARRACGPTPAMP